MFRSYRCALDQHLRMHIDLTKATIQICSLHSLPFVSRCFCFSCADAGSRSYNPSSHRDPLTFDSDDTDLVTDSSLDFTESRPLIPGKSVRANLACSTTFAALLDSTLYVRTSPKFTLTAYFRQQIFHYYILTYCLLSLEQHLVFICQ